MYFTYQQGENRWGLIVEPTVWAEAATGCLCNDNNSGI